MKMIPKSFLNKICKIVVHSDNQKLFYTAEIIEISDSHVSFVDKFGIYYSYLISEIIEINTQRGTKNEEFP